MIDPRDDFILRIDLRNTRVKPFSGFFFLCGGPQDTLSPAPLQSVRHLIYGVLTGGGHTDLVDRLKLAEDIQDWFRDGKYKDLVTFEEHLASLSSVILLVVESAGSIAELGAFAVTNAISGRLIALCADSYYEDDSFIRLGPINRLEADTGRKVLVYDWHDNDDFGRSQVNFEKMRPAVGEILQEVRALLGTSTGERVFRANEPSHVMLLMCELCDLFGALTENDIKSYIQTLSSDINSEQIEQFLFLLAKCGVLKTKARGHGRYFHAPDWRNHISFAFLDDRKIDRDRLRYDVVEYYKQHEKTRADVVRLLRKIS